MTRSLIRLLCAIGLILGVTHSAFAQLWDEEIGNIILAGNDDGSAGPIDLPFPVSIYGHSYTRFWINNNGNVTFDAALSEFTAFAFPNNSGHVIVAPFFADVDTRPAASGKVHYIVKPDRVVITWNGVGYYNQHAGQKNRFQLVLTNDGLAGFSYDYMQWTTGDVSGGAGGFGGSVARAGFDSGDGTHAVLLWEGNSDVSLDFLRHRTYWYNLADGTPTQDNFPPNTSIVTGPAEGGATNTNPVVFTFTGLDDVTPPNRLEYQWMVDDAAWSDWSNSQTATLNGLAEGDHVFRVRARDLTGKVDPTPAERHFSVDRTAPTISNVNANAQYVTCTVTWVTNEGASSQVEYGLTDSYGSSSSLDPALVTSHNVLLSSLATSTTYHYRVKSRDAAGNEAVSEDRSFRTNDVPDLQVFGVKAPGEIYTDVNFDFEWTDRNTGLGAANGPWTDKIYLSTDTTINSGDIVLGSFPFASNLAPGAEASRIQVLSIPRAGITTGNYFLLTHTDANNNVYEAGAENNNVNVRPIHVTLTPIPDLIVDSITAPSTAFSGQTIEVQFRIKNVGNGSTNASEWYDKIYLSLDNTPDGGDPIKIPVINTSYLDPNESYVATAEMSIPRGLTGNYKIIVYADDSQNVTEDNESNNFNRQSPINIQVPPLPDLDVISVDAPTTAFAGEPMRLSWRVENRGDTGIPSTNRFWKDRVYLSDDQVLNVNTDTLISTYQVEQTLPVGAGYSPPTDFTALIPINAIGHKYVFVKTDVNDEVWERNESNNDGYDMVPVDIQGTPPDLVVSALTVPTTGEAGKNITVSWTVTNDGAFEAKSPTGYWSDSIYVSTDSVFDRTTDKEIGVFTRTGTLAPGASYSDTRSVRLPACESGTYYVFVMTDSRLNVFEWDPGHDAEANNASEPRSLAISQKAADLRTSNITIPTNGNAGQPFTISWTVTNHGDDETNVATWSDRVYLSRIDTFDSSAISLNSVPHTGVLTPGGTYTQTATLTLPLSAYGQYFVYVKADVNDVVEECTNENNNTSRSAGRIDVTNNLPDLHAISITGPGSALSSASINFSWTVTNSGPTEVPATTWADSVYLSTDTVLDFTDRQLRSVVQHGPLAPGGTYNAMGSAMLPVLGQGTYYLIVSVDSGNFIFEGSNEGNNFAFTALNVSPPGVDLVVTSVDAPAEAFSGQTMPINWTVTNNGTDATLTGIWSDYVILSRDLILDPTDPIIGYAQHVGSLAGGASYTASREFDVPTGLTGPYYVFVRTDWSNAVAETDEYNNYGFDAGAVLIQLPPPTDLIVTTVTPPLAGSPGEPANITFEVRNAGTNPARGRWHDAAYLSKDETWDPQDVLIGRKEHVGDLAPGESYSASVDDDLPPILPDGYFVIIRTDVRNRVRESNETNNARSSSGTMAVDVAELPLGVPKTGNLQASKNKYYKTNVPAGETIAVTLDAQEDTATTELFLRYGNVASRSAFDYQYDRPWEPDQRIFVNWTKEGYYYSLDRSIVGTTNYTTLAEILPFSITEIRPNRIGNSGEASVVIRGAKFDWNTRVSVVGPSGPIPAKWQERTSVSEIHATFDLRGLAPGHYAVNVASKQQIYDVQLPIGDIVDAERVYGDYTLEDGIEVVAGGSPSVSARLSLPATVRRNTRFGFYAEVENTGLVDAASPILMISSPNGRPINVSRSIDQLSSSQCHVIVQGNARHDRLAPGERVVIPLVGFSGSGPKGRYEITDLGQHDGPIDWNALQSYYRDDRMTQSDWNHVWTRLLTEVGNTRASWNTVMRSVAAYLNVGRDETFVSGRECVQTLLARNADSPRGLVATRLAPRFVGPDIGEFRDGNNSFDDDDCNAYRVPPYNNSIFLAYVWARMNPYSGVPLPFNKGQALLLRWPGLEETLLKYLQVLPFSPSNFTTGPVADGIRNAPETKSAIKTLVSNLVNSNLEYLCQHAPADGSSMEVPLQTLPMAERDNSGDIKVNINYSPGAFDGVWGILVGGTGSSIYGPDKRLVSGSLFVRKRVDDCDKVIGLEVESRFNIQVIDAFDFCPGALGDSAAARYFTYPMAILEANGWATAIPINISTDLDPEFLSVGSESLPESCTSKNQCEMQPPAPPCSPPCDQDCTTGSNSGGSSDSCDDNGGDVDEPAPRDPNEKQGPSGFGPELWVAARQLLPYKVLFENVASASAPAQRIVVTDQLDANLDWRTFRVGEVAFGNYRFQAPANRAFWQTRVQLGPDLANLLCDITVRVDVGTGLVTWELQAIDPMTGEPPSSALLGLLPPNDPMTHIGEGYVTYTVLPKRGLPTGASIDNAATIIFDEEEPIVTNSVMNTVDGVVPVSEVEDLPTISASPTFTVNWHGSDDAAGSGLKSFDVYVSEESGAYSLWQANTTLTSSEFTGTPGKTYRFYSIARDNSGNLEDAPSTPDAVTTIMSPRTLSGRVIFQALSSIDRQPNPVTIELREVGSTSAFDVKTVTLGADGSYSIPVDARRMDISIKVGSWLRKTITVDARDHSVSIDLSLFNGDANNDNSVTRADYTLVGRAVNSRPGDYNWNPAADINKDGIVTIADVNAVLANMGRRGDR